MKTYKHLMDKLMKDETIHQGIRALDSKNEGKKKKIKKIKRTLEDNPDDAYSKARNIITNYEPTEHKIVTIYDGVSRKKREIIVPTFDDLLVQHCVMEVMRPIIMKPLYEHAYGSIPGRGIHKGKKVIERWIKNDPKNCKYFAQLDIKKCFPSVPLDKLEKVIRTYIKDGEFVKLFIKASTSSGVKGLPLGFYTSPWCINMYLTKLDHYIKEVLGVKHYMRYVDDMLLFGSNKKKLQKAVNDIIRYTSDELGLTINPDYQLARFSYKDKPRTLEEQFDYRKRKDLGSYIDFMGFKFFRTRTTLRKSLMLKISRKAKIIHKKRKISLHNAMSIISYMGWIYCTDTDAMYRKHISPYVNIDECRLICSRNSKMFSELKVA